MPDQDTLLGIRNLKTYFFSDEGTVKAVDDASLEIRPQATVGIVGESGCGKSVMARSILRIVEQPGRIVSGELLWKRGDGTVLNLAQLGEESTTMRSIRGGEIALIFQEPMTSLSPVHTVGNQIIEAIRLHQPVSKEQAREQAIDLLHEVGIPHPEQRIDSYPFQLSGGLRQRVVTAMALSCRPRLLIADEPTTALDVTTQAQILELLRELQARLGMTIMLITHDMGVIAEMVDEVVVMYLGRVVEHAPVVDIFHDPKHPYTKALLRSIPSILAEPRTELPTISGSIPHPYNRPRGCPFHPRCDAFMPGACDVYEPHMQPVSDRQQVSCFLYHEPKAETEIPGDPR